MINGFWPAALWFLRSSTNYSSVFPQPPCWIAWPQRIDPTTRLRETLPRVHLLPLRKARDRASITKESTACFPSAQVWTFIPAEQKAEYDCGLSWNVNRHDHAAAQGSSEVSFRPSSPGRKLNSPVCHRWCVFTNVPCWFAHVKDCGSARLGPFVSVMWSIEQMSA